MKTPIVYLSSSIWYLHHKSDYTHVNGGVPHGTLSGPEDFLHMSDDFDTCVDDVKYVDYSTLYEIAFVGESGQLQQAADEAPAWASINNMTLTASKTK